MEFADLYEMTFDDDGKGQPKKVQFRAIDASEALIIARQEAADRDVALWKDGKQLCRLRHDKSDLWIINGQLSAKHCSGEKLAPNREPN